MKACRKSAALASKGLLLCSLDTFINWWLSCNVGVSTPSGPYRSLVLSTANPQHWRKAWIELNWIKKKDDFVDTSAGDTTSRLNSNFVAVHLVNMRFDGDL